jgi:fumarylacetoacetase
MSALNSTHDPARRSWIESANTGNADFPIQNLPFGAFMRDGEARTGVAIGDRIVDLLALHDMALLDGDAALACAAARDGTLNALMALDTRHVSALRAALSALLEYDAPARPRLESSIDAVLPRMSDVELTLPCTIGDYTDFLTSLHHTERHGRYKGLVDPLPPAFKSLPIAYHGRASSLRASGGAVRRPYGQYRDADGNVRFGPAPMLDFELELAAVIGRGNELTSSAIVCSTTGRPKAFNGSSRCSGRSLEKAFTRASRRGSSPRKRSRRFARQRLGARRTIRLSCRIFSAKKTSKAAV